MLEVTTDRGEGLARVQALLGEVTGDALGEAAGALGAATGEEVVAKKSISEESLSWRWRLPDDTPPDHRRKLLAEQRHEAILEDWSNAPRAALQNKSPLEAVDQPDLRIALLASALIIEQAAVDPAELPLFETLREKLNLPQNEKIDPTDLDLEQVPLVRVPRFDFSKLPEDRLAKLLDRTGLMGANFAALIVAKEIVSRPELDERQRSDCGVSSVDSFGTRHEASEAMVGRSTGLVGEERQIVCGVGTDGVGTGNPAGRGLGSATCAGRDSDVASPRAWDC